MPHRSIGLQMSTTPKTININVGDRFFNTSTKLIETITAVRDHGYSVQVLGGHKLSHIGFILTEEIEGYIKKGIYEKL